jgi:NADPH-dependent ferric siderophore reductase
VPLPASVLGIPGVQPLEMQVVELGDLGPRMRRILLRAPAFDNSFAYQPGQDIMLVLGQAGDRPLSRRYSIRGLDRARGALELNVVVHGVHGPGAGWASAVQVGDAVNGVGPRGKITLDPAADWHLFVGDESAAPASLNMLEAVPADTPAWALLEVTDAEDELPSSAPHEVRWVHRRAAPDGAPGRLGEALAGLTLPPGTGHVYIAGEVQMVAALREAALGRGLEPAQVSAKAYWGRGRPNAPRGEPD